MKKTQIDSSLRLFATPFVVILVSVALIGVIINSALPGAKRKISTIKESKKNLTVLDQRLTVLREFEKGVIDDKSDQIYRVFPDRNPGAVALSQVRALSAEDKITIEGIEFSPQTESGDMMKTEIEYNLQSSDFNSIMRFLSKLQNSAPISTNDQIVMSGTTGGVQATLTTSVYWANLPSGLPSLTTPINDLTLEEKAILNKVYGFRVAAFEALTPVKQTSERPNPFN